MTNRLNVERVVPNFRERFKQAQRGNEWLGEVGALRSEVNANAILDVVEEEMEHRDLYDGQDGEDLREIHKRIKTSPPFTRFGRKLAS